MGRRPAKPGARETRADAKAGKTRPPPAHRTPSADEMRRGRQARTAALVLSVTIVAWVAAQWVGGALGWPVRFAFLFDFAALAAFVWALVVTYGIWRQGRKE